MNRETKSANKSPQFRAIIRELVPPILIRWSRRLLGKDISPSADVRELELVWAKHRYDASFDIDWNKTNFNRIAVINLLCAGQRCENYLEIGCGDNICFDAIIARSKIGVDPERGGTHRLTSDQFFKECGDRKFDVVFIDGMHTHEQVRRDVINSLRHITVGGWIVLHDMFPRNWLEEHVPQMSTFWVGDVWKLGFELARSCDIDFKILKLDCGIGVLQLTKENPIIPDLHTELDAESFRYFYENVGLLPVLDYERGRAWIEDRLYKRSKMDAAPRRQVG